MSCHSYHFRFLKFYISKSVFLCMFITSDIYISLFPRSPELAKTLLSSTLDWRTPSQPSSPWCQAQSTPLHHQESHTVLHNPYALPRQVGHNNYYVHILNICILVFNTETNSTTQRKYFIAKRTNKDANAEVESEMKFLGIKIND